MSNSENFHYPTFIQEQNFQEHITVVIKTQTCVNPEIFISLFHLSLSLSLSLSLAERHKGIATKFSWNRLNETS